MSAPEWRWHVQACRMRLRGRDVAAAAVVVERCAAVWGVEAGDVIDMSRWPRGRTGDPGPLVSARRMAVLALIDSGWASGDAVQMVGYRSVQDRGPVVQAARRQLATDPVFRGRVLGLYDPSPEENARLRPRIAIRPDKAGTVDDVVIRDVSMVRLERLGDHLWWMRCYLDGEDYIEFNIDYDGCLHEVSIADPDAYTWEAP